MASKRANPGSVAAGQERPVNAEVNAMQQREPVRRAGEANLVNAFTATSLREAGSVALNTDNYFVTPPDLATLSASAKPTNFTLAA